MSEAAPADDSIHGLLKFAGRLADAARPLSLKYFRTAISAETKADESPVTIADRETETRLRQMIVEAYPAHGIVGEEFGNLNADAENVWVIDPIDGTQSFITGKPLFGTLIGLYRGGLPLIGVMDMPALGERWSAGRGLPTMFDGAPARVRRCSDLGDAWLYATSPQMFTEPNFPRFESLRRACRRAVYGAECQAYGLLASGYVDLVCEDTLKPYDYAALIPIIEGAGGVITDWRGQALGFESDGTVLAAGDPALHAVAVEMLNR